MSVSPAAAVVSRCVSAMASPDLADSARVISWPSSSGGDRRRSRNSSIALGSEARDPRASKVDAGHEPLLIEDERAYIALRTGRRGFLRRSVVDDHDLRPGADLPLVGLAQGVERRRRHEEEDVPEGFDPVVDAAKAAQRAIVARGDAVLAQGTGPATFA